MAPKTYIYRKLQPYLHSASSHPRRLNVRQHSATRIDFLPVHFVLRHQTCTSSLRIIYICIFPICLPRPDWSRLGPPVRCWCCLKFCVALTWAMMCHMHANKAWSPLRCICTPSKMCSASGCTCCVSCKCAAVATLANVGQESQVMVMINFAWPTDSCHSCK